MTENEIGDGHESRDKVSEREKWLKEMEWKERELRAKDEAHALTKEEHDLKVREQVNAVWKSPILIAVITAAAVAVGNAAVSLMNAGSQVELEREKAEQARILEMIKTGNTETAAKNIKFLLEVGLIRNKETEQSLHSFLVNRKPGEGPSLPSPGTVIASDAAKQLQEFSTLDPIYAASKPVGKLEVFRGTDVTFCSAFLVKSNYLITAKFCIEGSPSPTKMILTLNSAGRSQQFEVDQQPVALGKHGMEFAVMRVNGNPNQEFGFMNLSSFTPKVGAPLSMIMYRGGPDAWIVSGSVGCSVQMVGATTISHRCETGPGTSGAPILSSDAKSVVALHLSNQNGTGEAIRADVIAEKVISLFRKEGWR